MARLVQDHRINVGAVDPSKKNPYWNQRYTSWHGSQEGRRGVPSRQVRGNNSSEFGEPMNFSDFYEFVRHVPFRSETKYRSGKETTTHNRSHRRGAFGVKKPKQGRSEPEIAARQKHRRDKSEATDIKVPTVESVYSTARKVPAGSQGSWYINPKTGGFREKGYKPKQLQPNRIPSDRRGQPIGGKAHDVRESESKQGPGKSQGLLSEFGDHEFGSMRRLRKQLKHGTPEQKAQAKRSLGAKRKGYEDTRSERASLASLGFKKPAGMRGPAGKTIPISNEEIRDINIRETGERFPKKGGYYGKEGKVGRPKYMIRRKGGRASEFGDMRNFSDEQFLLFFANQYPEAFHQIAEEFSEFGDQHEFVRQAADEDWNPPRRGRSMDQPMSTREYKSSGKPRKGRKLKIKLQPGGTVSQKDHERMRWKYNTASEFSDLHEFDCKRRLAKGREMLKFMEGYYA